MFPNVGCGGGASGRAMSICLSELGSNPGMDLAFSVQNCCQSILAGCQAFSERTIDRKVHFCFLSLLSNLSVAI